MKKIDHTYENFDADIFFETLNNLKSETQGDFISKYIIPSINGYNEANDEDGNFSVYLKDLVATGEFFKNIKNGLSVFFKFRNSIYKDRLWNFAYVLFFKKQKVCFLFNFEFEWHGNDKVYLIDKFNYNEKDILPDALENKLDQHTKSFWSKLNPDENWTETVKKFDNPKYIATNSLDFGKKYYEDYHSEALNLEHIEVK